MSNIGQERLPLKQTLAGYGSSPVPRRAGAGRLVDAAMAVAVPWVFFTLIVCLFAFAFEEYAPLVWAMAAASALLAALFVAMGTAAGGAGHVAVGAITLVSVGIGALVGLLLDHGYMGSYWTLENGAAYSGLDPTEAAASHADGARFAFARGSSVDSQRSVGYMRGGVSYCVAPIVGPRSSSTIEYWAVGRDCCDRRGGFACGAADEANGLAGVVATEDRGQYSAAVRMAQSVYRLAAPRGGGSPVFVEQKRDVAAHQKSLWWNAVRLMLLASGLHLVASCGAGFVLARLQK